MVKRVSQGPRIDKLDGVSFDQLLARQDPFNTPGCKFDLKGVQFITPIALVQLAAACHALARNGKRPVIAVDDSLVRTYLVRASFVSVLESVATFDPPFASPLPRVLNRLQGSNPLLIELTKFESGSSLPALLDKIVFVLRQRLKYRKRDAFDVATAVSEISQNSFDHNSQTCGFLAMQVYGRGAKRFLEIGVADCGDGLATSLRRNPKYKSVLSDLDAIRQATELGVSEHEDPTRGTGLYHLLEIAYNHSGRVQIRSGAGKLRYRMDQKQGWAFNVSQMPGVQVLLALPSKQRSRKSGS